MLSSSHSHALRPITRAALLLGMALFSTTTQISAERKMEVCTHYKNVLRSDLLLLHSQLHQGDLIKP